MEIKYFFMLSVVFLIENSRAEIYNVTNFGVYPVSDFSMFLHKGNVPNTTLSITGVISEDLMIQITDYACTVLLNLNIWSFPGDNVKFGEKYTLLIITEQHGYKLLLNGSDFRSTSPFSYYATYGVQLKITGGLTNKVIYGHNEPTWAFEHAFNEIEDYNLNGIRLPHKINHNAWRRLGYSYTIQGYVVENGQNIFLSFSNENANFQPLNMTYRLNDNTIILQSINEGKVIARETIEGLPYFGSNFTIGIVCDFSGYRMYLNGEELLTYYHRMPPDVIWEFNLDDNRKEFADWMLQKVVAKYNYPI